MPGCQQPGRPTQARNALRYPVSSCGTRTPLRVDSPVHGRYQLSWGYLHADRGGRNPAATEEPCRRDHPCRGESGHREAASSEDEDVEGSVHARSCAVGSAVCEAARRNRHSAVRAIAAASRTMGEARAGAPDRQEAAPPGGTPRPPQQGRRGSVPPYLTTSGPVCHSRTGVLIVFGAVFPHPWQGD